MRKTEKGLFDEYMENDYWREYYENAPSDSCKEYIRLIYVQDSMEENEFVGKTNALEKKFGAEEIKYIMTLYRGTPGWSRFNKRLKELEGETGR